MRNKNLSTDSRVLWNRKFITVFKTVRHWSYNQPDQHNTPITKYFSTLFNIILISTPRPFERIRENCSRKCVVARHISENVTQNYRHKMCPLIRHVRMSGLYKSSWDARTGRHSTISTREENTFYNVLLSCIVIYPHSMKEQDALFTFNLFQ